MAHGSDGGAIAVQVFERIPCDKKEKYCECCIKMKVGLSEMKLELSSCKEIIRISAN
jgi:hypothetical protein